MGRNAIRSGEPLAEQLEELGMSAAELFIIKIRHE